MKTLIQRSLTTLSAILLFTACAGTPRILTVQSEPADAQVCIKGKAGSKFLKNDKQCVGTTPYEAERIYVPDEDGKKRWVSFKDIEENKEQFYLVILRDGYRPQALNVPTWNHKVELKTEHEAAPVAAAAAPTKDEGQGILRISSNPVGALVYVNDYLKGNTPYVVEGRSGEPIRIKIEQTGYVALEKSVNIENGKITEVNLSLEKQESKEQMASAK